jgi:hypothetical protein
VLEVFLAHPDGRKVKVTFSDHLGFRKAGESDALVTLDNINSTSVLGRSFYLVEKSEYVSWFVNQSHGIQLAQSLKHVTIITIDDVIDVISLSLPSLSVY